MKYALITVSEREEITEHIFESDVEGLEFDPYGDDCPVVVGSNQIIRRIEDDSNKFFELKKTFGHKLNGTWYWKIFVFSENNFIADCVIENTFELESEEAAKQNMDEVIERLNLNR